MTRPSDYGFGFQYVDPNLEAKSAFYQLWVSPNHDQVELMNDANNYVKLDKKNSAILYEIITGETLQ